LLLPQQVLLPQTLRLRAGRMRFKNRYLLLELVWKDKRKDDLLLEPALLARFREALAACFGDLGAGLALQSLQVKYYNALTGLCIVRCSREQHRQARALLLCADIHAECASTRWLLLLGPAAAASTWPSGLSTADF